MFTHLEMGGVVTPSFAFCALPPLCTSTNATPHERFFNFQRRSALGISVPSWLSFPGTAYVRKRTRQSKYAPLIKKADLIHATPQYIRIRFNCARETTVFLKDVAPIPDPDWPLPEEKDVDSPCSPAAFQRNSPLPSPEASTEIDLSQPDTTSPNTSDKTDQSASNSDSFDGVAHHDPRINDSDNQTVLRRLSRTDRLT